MFNKSIIKSLAVALILSLAVACKNESKPIPEAAETKNDAVETPRTSAADLAATAQQVMAEAIEKQKELRSLRWEQVDAMQKFRTAMESAGEIGRVNLALEKETLLAQISETEEAIKEVSDEALEARQAYENAIKSCEACDQSQVLNIAETLQTKEALQVASAAKLEALRRRSVRTTLLIRERYNKVKYLEELQAFGPDASSVAEMEEEIAQLDELISDELELEVLDVNAYNAMQLALEVVE